LGDAEKAENGARRLAALLDRVLAAPREDCELLYGRCGYLHALLFARRRALGGKKKDQLLPMSLFRRVVEQVVEEGLANANRDRDEEKDKDASTKTRAPRLVHAWRGKRYLGAAHGACGIVTTLLQCWEEFGDAVFQFQSRSSDASVSKNALDETLFYLLSLSFADGNLPSSASSKSGNALVQWCHGAPGLIVLLAQRLRMAIRAGESVASRDFLAHKTRVAAESVWRRGLTKKGPGLCHGASGNGYALLVASRALMSHDPVLGRLLEARAKRFALWVSEHAAELATELADAPGSLFEGLAGAVAFVADAADATDAWFPGSEA
jgi:lantibiotic modifying enzyme